MSQSFDSADPLVAAVRGENTAGGDGVFGKGARGVVGESTDNAGVSAESKNFSGVFALSHSTTSAGAEVHNAAGGFGLIARSDRLGKPPVLGEQETGSPIGGGVGIFASGAQKAAIFEGTLDIRRHVNNHFPDITITGRSLLVFLGHLATQVGLFGGKRPIPTAAKKIFILQREVNNIRRLLNPPFHP